MSIRRTGGLVLLALLTPAVTAQAFARNATPDTIPAPASSTFTVQPESKLWVEGSSTVRRYRCEATQLDATVEASSANPGIEVAQLGSSVRGVRVRVPVAELRCGDNTMDGHMRKALKAEANPNIQFRLSSHEVVAAADGTGTVRMTGALSIAGAENTVEIDATAGPGSNGTVRIVGSKQLRMTEFGVKPPSLMLGTMKVHDPVTVHFEMVLKP